VDFVAPSWNPRTRPLSNPEFPEANSHDPLSSEKMGIIVVEMEKIIARIREGNKYLLLGTAMNVITLSQTSC
jgi:hypothetical protein